MKKKIITIMQYIFFLGLGIFLVWWSSKDIDEQGWIEIKNSVANANYWVILPVLGILFLSHWVRALRWIILMEPLGYKPKKSNTFFAVMIGYLANLAVPRLGEVLKCTLLARYEKIPAEKLVGTMILERAIDVISLLTVIILTIITQTEVFSEFINQYISFKDFQWQSVMSYKILIIILAGGALLYFLTRHFLKRFRRIKFIHNINKLLKGVLQGLFSVRHIKNKGLFFIYSIAIWGMYYFSTYLGLFALQETSSLGATEALSVLSFGSIGMIVTQGGIGAYQLIIQKTMLLYEISENIGLAFGWLLWLAQTFVVLFLGLLSFGLLPYFNRRK
jgi:glycosyltransferase 2 family protein